MSYQRFENYILTRTVDPSAGLTAIADSSFTHPYGPSGYGPDDAFHGVGAGGTLDSGAVADDSVLIPIGFDFQLDGIVYKNVTVSTCGCMALVDPAVSTFSFSDIISGELIYNAAINATFGSNTALLAPWMDFLRNLASHPIQLASIAGLAYSSAKIARVSAGLEPQSIFYDPTAYGVSYYYDVRSSKGRRFVVRWTSASNNDIPASVIKFEAVLYENGTIEFRYHPRVAIAVRNSSREAAAIGIFMPNGTNRFRDFAAGLGYRDSERKPYIYGGYVYDSSYADSVDTVPYTVSLKTSQHWPGQTTMGSIFTFAPPQERRRILPRKLVRSIDVDGQLGGAGTAFDDRRSMNFGVPSVVNYPSTLPRFFGDTAPGTAERQDIFTGDFLVTGSTVRGAIDQFVAEQVTQGSNAFSEAARPEQSPGAATDAFFVTGSDPNLVCAGFGQPLRSKTQVRFSLPVDYTMALPAVTSSIFYYNSQTKAWEVPANTTYIMDPTGTGVPSPNPGAGGDWVDPRVAPLNGRASEDARGFGAFGNPVSSGSLDPIGLAGTDPIIDSHFVPKTLGDPMSKTYVKSVRNNPEYSATDAETFTLPITEPFLVEKAVIELPLAAGPGWFADQTQHFLTLGGATSGDVGGPALTVALFNQISLSRDGHSVTVRDLILSGTVTHELDDVAQIAVSQFPPYDSTYQVWPVGLRAYAAPAAAVVPGDGSATFSGSVSLKCQALNSTGLSLAWVKDTVPSADAITMLSKTPIITLVSEATQYVRVSTISPMGRSGNGISVSGRSVLGNEFVTSQRCDDQKMFSVPNPFPQGVATPTQLATITGAGTVNMGAAVQVFSHKPAPYLVMPGDKLILSVSKTRPVIGGLDQPGNINVIAHAPTFLGVLPHDVSMLAGNINITLYGSQVSGGTEFHRTTNQRLNTNVVHTVVGDEPVLDQFEPAYSLEFDRSYTDRVMLGSLLTTTTVNGTTTYVQGVRDLKYTRLAPRNYPPLTTSAVDLAINPYKSYRIQPWYERAGNMGVRLVTCVDPVERYYDSMMPNVSDCFRADGCSIFIAGSGLFGDPLKVDVGSALLGPGVKRSGWILMDVSTVGIDSMSPVVNRNWNKAFPFEVRYQSVARQLQFVKTLIAKYSMSSFGTLTAIEPVSVTGLLLGSCELNSKRNTPLVTDWYSDVNLSGLNVNNYYTTGSMETNGLASVLFGFGDRNTCFQLSSDEVQGTNHSFDYTDAAIPTSLSDSSYFLFQPRIRGWKYGVQSGTPLFNKCYFRRGHFGQFRDMLEQRPFAKFYNDPTNSAHVPGFQQGVQPAVVTVKFINAESGRLTPPENTWSNNISSECVSSTPYFDGIALSRPPIVAANLNLATSVVATDEFNNIRIS